MLNFLPTQTEPHDPTHGCSTHPSTHSCETNEIMPHTCYTSSEDRHTKCKYNTDQKKQLPVLPCPNKQTLTFFPVYRSTRRIRAPVQLSETQLLPIITACTDSITHILLRFNGPHISKVKHNDNKRREFTCSMLYLMRSGVDARGECILPHLPIMHDILPLEAFLPEHFNIRSKSITEGENLLKIEIQHTTAAFRDPTTAALPPTSANTSTQKKRKHK
jgi:hypothetical protein